MVYEENWRSLREHPVTPQWLKDAKFGIYTHWGIYSVPGHGPNGSWYGHRMYQKEDPGNTNAFHTQTYGPVDQFGYKDLIPLFTAEKFDPDEWAELFADSGARFAGPVAEHHDGFSMWDTSFSRWNAAKMGPKRDVVAELEKAYRAKGMKFLCALHHYEHWWFFQHWLKADHSFPGDRLNPEFSEFYGTPGSTSRADEAFLKKWYGKTKEVIDRFQPDALWFDFGLRWAREDYKQKMIAYYYNQAELRHQDVCLMYKLKDSVVGSGMIDLELGGFDRLMYNEWITDTTIDDGQGWSWLRDTTYKPASQLIHYLVDNVSKNGYMLLNVGPKPDGSIPEEAKSALKEMGMWLRQNGEAIYETTPWLVDSEGEIKTKSGDFSEERLAYTSKDIRYTVGKDGSIYATALAWDDEKFVLKSLQDRLYDGEVRRVTMLGDGAPLAFRMEGDGLHVQAPTQKPAVGYAYVLKIERSYDQITQS